MSEWWARVRAHHDKEAYPAPFWLCVFVPFQSWHVSRNRRKFQSDLVGQGVADIKVVLPLSDTEKWNFGEAVEYCKGIFEEHKNKDPEESLFFASLEGLSQVENAQLAPICIAPNGLYSQPICLPVADVEKLVSDARSDQTTFLALENAGIQSIRTRSLDWQPVCFQEWFADVVAGKSNMPGKRPKSWNLYARNRLITVTANLLVRKGLTLYRNDTSPPTSVIDAIAEGANKVGISGAKSYDSVKKIYSQSN